MSLRTMILGLGLVAVGCSHDATPSCFDWTSSSPASPVLFSMGYQGGGPTFAAVLRARLEADSPSALAALDLDDEADALRICSVDPAALLAARNAVGRMERDETLLRATAALAANRDDME